MKKINNYQAVLDQIVELMMQHDIECTTYQQDIYLYIDDDGNGSVDLFANVGGNSWIDDDHITVCCMKECTSSWSDEFQDTEQIADVLGVSEYTFVESVREWLEVRTGWKYEHDDIGYDDAYNYVREHPPIEEKLDDARADLIRDQREYYVDRAESELDEALAEQ